MNIFFFGDVFSKSGRKCVKTFLPDFILNHKIDFVIANGENLANGRGITSKTAKELFDVGVDAFTTGNHLWDKKDGIPFIESDDRVVIPLNYPKRTVGTRYKILKKENKQLAVLCLLGQAFMGGVDFPFESLENILPQIKKITNNVLVDFHAEATAEKRAMGFLFDGKISALIGTHTHIQTADEEILPNGTAYLTDAGMTGPHDSIIGIEKDIILNKMLTCLPNRYVPATTGNQINGVVISIDEQSGKANKILRIREEMTYE